MRTKFQILLMALVLGASTINAATIFVDYSASGSNDGSTWADAYTILQSALDVAVSGDEIWVAKGAYLPTTKVVGTSDRAKAFQMVDGVAIYGGFAGTESAVSERTDYSYGETNETTLSGDFDNNDVVTGSGSTLAITGNGENTYHLFNHPSGYTLTETAVLDGFTLKGGNADGSANPWNDGGAIYNQVGQSPTINNCYFTGNEARDNGACIVNANSADATITNCYFITNLAGVGTTEGGAGGIYNYDSSPQITNCLFYGNRVSGGTNDLGGAIFNNNASNPTITSCTIIENYARSGGGIYNMDNSDPTIINCIIWGNTIGVVGAQIRNNTNSNLTLSYSDIEGGISGGIYSSNGGSTTDGGGNINSDPKFVGSTLNSSHPYSIYGDSPCADVGSDAANSESYDIRGTGFDRKLSKTDGTSGTIDIGAYEYKFNSDPTIVGRYYVDANATGSNNGSNWTNAFTSFQTALDNAVADDEIWVAAGTYKPSSAYDLTNTSRFYHFRMIEGVTIYGGFAGTETASSERTDYGFGDANESILSSDFNGDDVVSGSGSSLSITNNTENSYHVFYHPTGTNLTGSAVLDGFTITGGYADGSPNHTYGSGMFNYGSSPSINYCTFTGNETQDNGGGMFNRSSSAPTITNSTFSKNSATYGGGMYNLAVSPSITYCNFTGNKTSFHGAGMANYSPSSPTITSCNFSENAGAQGAGIFIRESTPTITNCIFISNEATAHGGGLNINICSPNIINCTFAQNSSDTYGGGIYLSFSSSTPTIENSIFWDNTATTAGNEIYNYSSSNPTFSYCNIEGSGGSSSWAGSSFGTDGGNNIDSDPKFVGSSENADHPYLIYGNSPCADAGDTDPNNDEDYDIRGYDYGRKLDKTNGSEGIIDMGAYEYKYGEDPNYPPVIYVDDDKTGNGSSWADAYTSFQSALDEAVSGQEIWVAKGTYKPSQETDGTTDAPREFTFQMINDVEIYGGFAGTETATSQRTNYGSGGDNETTLSGDIGTVNNTSDNCYHVFYHQNGLGLNSTAQLDGFTITKGNADGTYPHYNGGGIYNFNCSPTIINCTFTLNTAVDDGGGLYNYNSSSNITNCTFTYNSAKNAPGIMNNVSSSTISGCSFTYNQDIGSGRGAVYEKNSSSTIKNCDFSNNDANYGAALYFSDGSTSNIINSLFTNNTGSSGGAIYLTTNTSAPTITNCTFANNSAYNGGAVYNNQSATPNFKNCILWNNSATNEGNEVFDWVDSGEPTYSNCDIEGSKPAGVWDTDLGTDDGNNIDFDPLFADAGEDDFRLSSYSPCADVGDNSANSQTNDIRGSGYGRKLDKDDGTSGTIDMGAYEFLTGTDPEYAITTWTGTVTTAWITEENWSGRDTPTMYYNITIPDVTNDPIIATDASANCNNLTINSGATLTIKSTESGTGSLITTGTITNNGTVNVERYVSESVWHLISVPNNVTTANTFAGNYLQTWDETTAAWDDITELTTELNPVQGYGFWGTTKATTYTFTGTPNTGAQTATVTLSNNFPDPEEGNDGANLLGNPYPSSIDWSGLDDTWGAVYYYNGTAYVSWNDGSGDGSQYVPPMQGFFIVTAAAGTFELTNTNRAHSSQAYYKSAKSNSIVLETKSKDYSDKLYISFDGAATAGFDLKYDAYKFQSGTEGLSELYSITGEKILSIDVRPTGEVIQLGFNNSENGIYNIGINEITDISEAILEDTKTETFHNLKTGSYEFIWNIEDNEKRFKLHLDAVGIEEGINVRSNILIYASGQDIYIKGTESGKVMISDIMGRIVMEKNISGSELNTISVNLKTGIYVVMVVNGGNVVTKKVFIK